jgi:hypothetical protein
MRIAFDLDDTLIPCEFSFPLERPPRLARWLSAEPLRLGTVGLFRRLRAAGCQVWVYTTSLRDPFSVRIQFASYGIWLGGIINQDRHVRKLRTRAGATGHAVGPQQVSKYPPAFGIDLLVDNCAGVVLEARRYGFRVVHVQPEDEHWQESVLRAVGLTLTVSPQPSPRSGEGSGVTCRMHRPAAPG